MSERKLSEISIVRQLAGHTAQRVTRRVITALQQLTDCKLSGDDSLLENAWDEICAQVQAEQSLYWDAYVETVRAFLRSELKNLAALEREALWLQTKQGNDLGLRRRRKARAISRLQRRHRRISFARFRARESRPLVKLSHPRLSRMVRINGLDGHQNHPMNLTVITPL